MEQQQWEDQVRRFINEELDRRMREENKRAFIRESNPHEPGSHNWHRWNYGLQPFSEWVKDFDPDRNRVAVREPEVPWQERHDRPKPVGEWNSYGGWEHYCQPQRLDIAYRGWVESCSECGVKRPEGGLEQCCEVGRGWTHYCSALNGEGLVPEGFVRCGYCGVERA